MAGRGPAPKTQHQRERDTRRRQAEAVHLTADGVLRGPEFPDWIADPPRRHSVLGELKSRYSYTDWVILAGGHPKRCRCKRHQRICTKTAPTRPHTSGVNPEPTHAALRLIN